MKSYLFKMYMIVLVICSLLHIVKAEPNEILTENVVVNNIVYKNDISYYNYLDTIVYENFTLGELNRKVEKYFSSSLDGYGERFVSLALDYDVDPFVAAAIVLHETGCTRNCSGLVKYCNNIGGMRGKGCNGYAHFDSIDKGMKAFISNLSRNYYKQGLNTPYLINKKYAENPYWYQDIDYFVKLIKKG